MIPYLFGQNNEDSICGSYNGLNYFPSISYQEISKRDLNNILFFGDDRAILYF